MIRIPPGVSAQHSRTLGLRVDNVDGSIHLQAALQGFHRRLPCKGRSLQFYLHKFQGNNCHYLFLRHID